MTVAVAVVEVAALLLSVVMVLAVEVAALPLRLPSEPLQLLLLFSFSTHYTFF